MAGTVVITGASAGVGRAVAEAFGRRGCKVALLARGTDGLEGARREVERLGGQALILPTDVADAEAVESAAARAEAELGPIGTWVNAAMITSFSPFAEMEADEFRRITEVVYLGTVHGTMAALRRMRPRGRGVVVQVGSALAHRALPVQSDYCGAKFAVRGFNEAVRVELRRESPGVRLSVMQLPAMNTPQFDWARNRMGRRPMPAPPIFRPEAVAEAVLRAADTGPRELWVGLPAARLIVGAAVAPGLMDRLMARWGVEAQQAPEPEPGGRPDNHAAPLPGDHGANGRFGAAARGRVTVLDPDRLRWFAAAGLGGLVLARLLGRRGATLSGRIGRVR